MYLVIGQKAPEDIHQRSLGEVSESGMPGLCAPPFLFSSPSFAHFALTVSSFSLTLYARQRVSENTQYEVRILLVGKKAIWILPEVSPAFLVVFLLCMGGMRRYSRSLHYVQQSTVAELQSSNGYIDRKIRCGGTTSALCQTQSRAKMLRTTARIRLVRRDTCYMTTHAP